jgi:hypothetical protein
MNLQVIASPDKRAEWIWGVIDGLEKAGIVTLADKDYPGRTWAKTLA